MAPPTHLQKFHRYCHPLLPLLSFPLLHRHREHACAAGASLPADVKPRAHPVERTHRERARVGSQISFALPLSGVSFFKPVAASRVCDCAPAGACVVKDPRGLRRPALCVRPSPHSPFSRRVLVRMRPTPLGGAEPRRGSRAPEETPAPSGPASARFATAIGREGRPASPSAPFSAWFLESSRG